MLIRRALAGAAALLFLATAGCAGADVHGDGHAPVGHRAHAYTYSKAQAAAIVA